MSKEKKAFKDTTFGKILGKAGSIVPDAIAIGTKAIMGNPMGAVQDLVGKLTKIDTPEAKALLSELDVKMAEIELEFSKVELEETKAYLADMQNARNREIELAKVGKVDWMQTAVGLIGMIMLAFNLYVLVFIEVPKDNKVLFIHFMGIIEGIAISIFSYYYGSSKGSKDKTDLMKK
jgi:hypothetical protein